jgi:hypothetical protein
MPEDERELKKQGRLAERTQASGAKAPLALQQFLPQSAKTQRE